MAILIKKSMRLFGLPYQFTDAVDPRLSNVSSKIGTKFLQDMIVEGPICTFIPGEPDYLPSETTTDKKVSTTALLLQGAANGFSSIKSFLDSSTVDDFRLYDFKRSYTEYMKYVNILCRAGATFLELNTELDGVRFQNYDWRNYRQDSDAYTTIGGTVANSAANAVKNAAANAFNNIYSTITGNDGNFLYETTDAADDSAASIEDMITNHNYVQFYVDSDVSTTDNFSNTTSESQLKSLVDTGSNYLKDLSFMLNSGGIDTEAFNSFIDTAASGLETGVQQILGSGNMISSALSRIINLGGNVLKGENIIIPDIYQSSEYSKSYEIVVHLRTPYGTKLGYYMDIFVPMMHLLALALPREASANSYGSPFLVKAFMEGQFTINLGIVESISISRVRESLSVDGLPTEVDVSLQIKDLYSDLTMAPQSSPVMFVNNSSLIEFLATNCGLSLISPNIKTRLELTLSTGIESITSIPDNISSAIKEAIDNQITSFTGLTW